MRDAAKAYDVSAAASPLVSRNLFDHRLVRFLIAGGSAALLNRIEWFWTEVAEASPSIWPQSEASSPLGP
jgi:hypothetical protein